MEPASYPEEKRSSSVKQEIDRLPLRERNKQRIAQRILNAAFDLFSTTGYAHTTIDAIAEKAEVSRGTLFNYFPSKGALLIPFVKRLYLQNVQPEIQPFLNSEPTTRQALYFLFILINDRIFFFPDVAQAIQQELLHDSHHDGHKEMDINSGTGFLDNIQAILRYGQQRAEVRVDIPLGNLVRYIAVLYISLLSTVLRHNSREQYNVEIDTLLTFIESALVVK
jgi:AcrR family transcriptional regulator